MSQSGVTAMKAEIIASSASASLLAEQRSPRRVKGEPKARPPPLRRGIVDTR